MYIIFVSIISNYIIDQYYLVTYICNMYICIICIYVRMYIYTDYVTYNIYIKDTCNL